MQPHLSLSRPQGSRPRCPAVRPPPPPTFSNTTPHNMTSRLVNFVPQAQERCVKQNVLGNHRQYHCKHSFILIAPWPVGPFDMLLSTIQQMVHYCDTVLNESYTGDRQPTKASVIKNCQVIRMLTAYAVTMGRTVARGWRIVVRSSSATRKRHRHEFQIHAWPTWIRRARSACGVRHRRPGLHGASLAVRVGWLRWQHFLTGHPVAEQSAELSPSNRSLG